MYEYSVLNSGSKPRHEHANPKSASRSLSVRASWSHSSPMPWHCEPSAFVGSEVHSAEQKSASEAKGETGELPRRSSNLVPSGTYLFAK